MKVKVKKLDLTLLTLALTISFAAYSTSLILSQKAKITIKIDGSSTVYPITQGIVKAYQANPNKKVQFAVKISVTIGGFEKLVLYKCGMILWIFLCVFALQSLQRGEPLQRSALPLRRIFILRFSNAEKFCAGETDISNASRPILKSEMEACKKNGVVYLEFPIAFDALTVAVNPQNDWAKDITQAQLKKIWEPSAQGKITRWNQVPASWPDRPMNLFNQKSGTFDYFTEATVGKIRASRNDYTASEDDRVLVNDIIKDPNPLGYFGYACYEKHQNELKALAIDNGKGAVLPSHKTVEKVQYQPLARPLLIYLNFLDNEDKKLLNKFVEFSIVRAPTIATTLGYIPLLDETKHLNYVHLYQGKVGTVVGGKVEINMTIGELLRKEGKF
ncbi:PstS family phosphate ABC transporter substrate-binding protein [Nostoc sp.]|uniref:PstS family phosphate ABC transporter substrate-binding protein n=1 Tax=Nostoc sp. TaxID=1180 RepID=UPI002FF9D0CC